MGKRGMTHTYRSKESSFVSSNSIWFQFAFNLMRSGFGALLSTDAKIVTKPTCDQYRYFVLGRNSGHLTFSLSLLPETLATCPVTSRFVDVMKELFACDNPLPLLAQLV